MGSTSGIQLKLNQQNIWIIVAILVSSVTAQQRVDTQPQSVALLEGDSTELLCRIGRPLTYCRIEIPQESVLVLSPEWNKEPGFSYFGDGLATGQCGVKIDRVKSRNHGEVKCFLAAEGEEVRGSINLVVALPPSRPDLDIITPARGGSYEVNQPLRVKCISRDGRPPANITWFIDGEPIYQGLSQPEVYESIDSRNTTLYTVTQEIQRHLSASDDGKSLICRSSHLADRGEVNEAKLQLSVKFRPLALPDVTVYGLTLDSRATINVTIQSNPRPRTIWRVDGIQIPEGEFLSRYEAHVPIDLGAGEYNVSLTILGLTLEDTNKNYILTATNDFGSQDYTVRISRWNQPEAEGLGIGAIVGIIAVVAVIVLVVLLLVFARATSRWCFRAAGPKSSTNETSDTESADVKQSKFRKFPTFEAIFKKKSEKEKSTTTKKDNNSGQDDEHRRLSDPTLDLHETRTDPNNDDRTHDDVPKEEKQLVYAELVLKPTGDEKTKPITMTAQPKSTTEKPSTEYAEIVYVQKPTGSDNTTTDPPNDIKK